VIRPFASGDRRGLIAAIDAVCSEGRWMSTLKFEPAPAWLHALAQPGCPHHLLLVVESERAVVGWCRLFPTRPGYGLQREASLGIGLLQPHRDRGVGTSLVLRALEWASSVGTQVTTLSTRSDNTRAIHVFRKCGFIAADRLPDDHLEMRCNLNPL